MFGDEPPRKQWKQRDDDPDFLDKWGRMFAACPKCGFRIFAADACTIKRVVHCPRCRIGYQVGYQGGEPELFDPRPL